MLRTIAGNADVNVEQITGQPVLQIQVKQDELARYGVPAKAVLDLVESVGSKPLGEVVEGQLRFPLVVRLPEKDRGRARRRSGRSWWRRRPASASRCRGWRRSRSCEGPSTITREWGQRRITVTCNVRGRDLGSFVAEAQRQGRRARCSCRRAATTSNGAASSRTCERARTRLLIVVPRGAAC